MLNGLISNIYWMKLFWALLIPCKPHRLLTDLPLKIILMCDGRWFRFLADNVTAEWVSLKTLSSSLLSWKHAVSLSETPECIHLHDRDVQMLSLRSCLWFCTSRLCITSEEGFSKCNQWNLLVTSTRKNKEKLYQEPDWSDKCFDLKINKNLWWRVSK